MFPVNQPLQINQRATFDKKFTWFSGPKGLETPVDLTGATAAMHVRVDKESATDLLVLTTSNGRIILGGVNGTIQLLVSAADTTPLTWAKALYDLLITFPSGKVVRFFEGEITVSKGITP